MKVKLKGSITIVPQIFRTNRIVTVHVDFYLNKKR